MSTVWLATDLRLDAQVAVKLLDPTIAENEKVLARFFREAKTIARLRSRHVIRVFDCGVEAGAPFMVMERLEGHTLRDLLARKRVLSPAETFRVLGDVAKAMHAAHEQGIVHRDLKPDNVFLAREDNEDVVKVLDFGIAKRLAKTGADSSALTEAGDLFGTPSYMSPEQIDASCVIDHHADIWALAVIAFECLTGRLPFVEETLQDQFLAICVRPIPVPSSIAEVPPGFDDWFAKGTSREINRRFASAIEARAELALVCGQSIAPRPAPAPRSPEVPGESYATLKSSASAAVNPVTSAPVTSSPAARPKRLSTLSRMTLSAVGLLTLLLAAYLGFGPPKRSPPVEVTMSSTPAVTDDNGLSRSPVSRAAAPNPSLFVTAPLSESDAGIAAPIPAKAIVLVPASAPTHSSRAPMAVAAPGRSVAQPVHKREAPASGHTGSSTAARHPRVDLGL
jgi:serine/threonine-protein kinase